MIELQSADRELRRAAKRDAAASSLWTDLVIYGLLTAVMGCTSMLSRGFDVVTVSLGAGGSLVAVISWMCTYLRHRNHFIALYLREWNARLRLVRDEELVRLAARLESLGVKEGTAQVKDLRQVFDTFRRILKRKFNVTELTYQRYDLLLENLFLSALDNLERAAELLETVTTISRDKGKAFDPRDSRFSLEALNASANELLEKNKVVLAAIQKAGIKMSKVETRRGKAKIELGVALDELSRMVNIVDRYAVAKI
jgi:hypothetical protein